MAQKETDLLRDPVGMAQLRYREQIDAFITDRANFTKAKRKK